MSICFNMHLLVLAALIGFSIAYPYPAIYSGPPGSGLGSFSGYGQFTDRDEDDYIITSDTAPYPVMTKPGKPPKSCGPGDIMRSDGVCVKAIITRNVYVYSAPEIIAPVQVPPPIPRPRINYNVVFVRTPERPGSLEPIVIPPPQQKTLVFVLTKNDELKQKIIEIPSGTDAEPEVFYINYNEGDDMKLPGDITLKEALASQQAREGQTVFGDQSQMYDVGTSSGGTSVITANDLYST